MKVFDAAYNAIKRRHNAIPQEPLFEWDAPDAEQKGEAKQRPPRSVRFAVCPYCLADKPTGVIRTADAGEVFRDHNKVLNSGLRIPCHGSGKVAPS